MDEDAQRTLGAAKRLVLLIVGVLFLWSCARSLPTPSIETMDALLGSYPGAQIVDHTEQDNARGLSLRYLLETTDSRATVLDYYHSKLLLHGFTLGYVNSRNQPDAHYQHMTCPSYTLDITVDEISQTVFIVLLDKGECS